MDKEQTPIAYRFRECECLIESARDNREAVTDKLYELLERGKTCFDSGIGFEYDAFRYFTHVLEYTTYSQDHEKFLKKEFHEVAREAYEYLCSLSGCDSDEVWERSATERSYYKHLFE